MHNQLLDMVKHGFSSAKVYQSDGFAASAGQPQMQIRGTEAAPTLRRCGACTANQKLKTAATIGGIRDPPRWRDGAAAPQNVCRTRFYG